MSDKCWKCGGDGALNWDVSPDEDGAILCDVCDGTGISDPKLMKVLILVLSARRHPWNNLMDASIETWDSVQHPQTQTVFYCGNYNNGPTGPNIWYSINHDESLEKIAARTLEAFELSLALEWDYMARAHSSCYVHKGNLVKYCETLPPDDVLCGIMTGGLNPFIWGGGHFVFSRDVIERIVANKDKWNPHHHMEDNAITEISTELKIPVTHGITTTINCQPEGYLALLYGYGENFNFTEFNAETAQKLDRQFFFRCKQDQERHKDIEIFRGLFRCLP